MSFKASFEKSAAAKDMSDVELEYKVEKHFKKLKNREKAPLTGAATGATLGGAAGATQKARGKTGWLGAALISAGGAAGGAAAGKAIKGYHEGKVRKYESELNRRGMYGFPTSRGFTWRKARREQQSEG